MDSLMNIRFRQNTEAAQKVWNVSNRGARKCGLQLFASAGAGKSGRGGPDSCEHGGEWGLGEDAAATMGAETNIGHNRDAVIVWMRCIHTSNEPRFHSDFRK